MTLNPAGLPIPGFLAGIQAQKIRLALRTKVLRAPVSASAKIDQAAWGHAVGYAASVSLSTQSSTPRIVIPELSPNTVRL